MNQHTNDDPQRAIISKDLWCKLIAGLEIVGGVSIIFSFFYTWGFALPNYWLALVLTVGIWGVYGGWHLWQGSPKGLRHSLYLQAIQIITIEGSAVCWRAALGVGIVVGYFSSGNYSVFSLGGKVAFSLLDPAMSFGIGVNLVGLAALIYLSTVKGRLERQGESSDLKDHHQPAEK